MHIPASPPAGGLGAKSLAALVACLILLTPISLRAEKVEQLNAQGYVSDFAGVLSGQAKQQLTALCTEVDQKTHAQIAVVTIHTLEGLEASEFGNRLFARWGVGHKNDNRGVLILLAIDDHKYWIEVGYGLEPILPDGKVGGFGREMVPKLRANDYTGALLHATSQIAGVIAGDRGVTLNSMPSPGPTVPGTVPPKGAPTHTQPESGLDLSAIVFWLVVLVFVFLVFITRGRLLWWLLLAILQGSTDGRSRSGGGFGGSGGGSFGGFGGGASGGGGAGGSW